MTLKKLTDQIGPFMVLVINSKVCSQLTKVRTARGNGVEWRVGWLLDIGPAKLDNAARDQRLLVARG